MSDIIDLPRNATCYVCLKSGMTVVLSDVRCIYVGDTWFAKKFTVSDSALVMFPEKQKGTQLRNWVPVGVFRMDDISAYTIELQGGE